MRLALLVGSVCVLVLLAAAPGSAQVVQSFEDLALRVNLDDQIQVENETGGKATGRIIRLTPGEVAIQTAAGETRLARDTVRRVAVRGHSLARGATIGAVAFAVLGAVAVCSHEGGGACAIVGPLGAAPVGAGVGLAVGALVPRMRTVYSSSGIQPSAPAVPAASGPRPSLLEDLALRVNLDDQIRVRNQSGTMVTGRLTALTADEMTVRTAAGERRFSRDNIRQVELRRQPLRMAVLIGAAAGAVSGAVLACAGADRSECADGPILTGGLGAGLGLAAGALMRTTTIVYPQAKRRIAVSPVMGRGTVGVGLGFCW